MEIAKKTIKGDFREENQDRIEVFKKENSLFAILCDGMGGHFGGGVAAAVTISFFQKAYEENTNLTINNCQRWFFDSVENIKKEMRILASSDQRKMDMGTTTTAILIFEKEKTLIVFNIGDSRTYVFTKENNLRLVTRDQNLYNKLLNEGVDKKIAERNLFSNSLTSSIGPSKSTTIEITELREKSFEKISKIILTSDGVHNFVSVFELVDILKNKNNSAQDMIDDLIDTAQMNNSNDNMSAILVDMKGDDEQ